MDISAKLYDFTKQNELLKDLQIIGCVNETLEEKNGLQLLYDIADEYPIVKSNNNERYSFILFQPPNFRNLEYFSINPILLQSTGNVEVNPNDEIYQKKLTEFDPITRESKLLSISDDEVLDKINQSSRYKNAIQAWIKRSMSTNISPSFLQRIRCNEKVETISRMIFQILISIVSTIQMLTIWIIWILNYEFRNIKLIDCSHVFRQLDLRLQQINFFPIQFLCYYDKNILYGDSEVLHKLKIPVFNSNLNINNSNYINLYNSIWLIFNDVLLGISTWKIIISNFDSIIMFINETIIKKLLFNDFYDLILWVSVNHPAGFKLNTELGQFMGDLFLWTLKFWKFLVADILMIDSDNVVFRPIELNFSYMLGFVGSWNNISAFHKILSQMLKIYVGILCHLGFTFFIGCIIDYFQIITFHLYCFYFTSTKIYQKQIQIIKSLFQLFCGKKYNVLRNRIDNLNNYTYEGQFFDIDQLLLGTLLFMILVLLLPTVFAFYLMFFLSRLACIIVVNSIENLLIIINYLPLFVILLKLKNSNRLQGGITFNHLTVSNKTDYLLLSNKSLTYSEIFKNFVKLFKKSKNFKESLIQFFVLGELVSLKHNYRMIFNYLMLPENYDKTTEIWKPIITSNKK
ncbi:uncharacterized protein AC631_02807 [Debaryomyces fabryi]|uniref:Uncharacterized protein n=1 Tax=Debaryomyces fabryi TaxID=58627 RepID=A0A0V1PYV4_9ASCO|nr:uncharacterized protein AC631_02807 [Debaryomyces fabryi]KSA01444.1 hypothetical protein AC631_02807 [Debaryomyces fabryi]CUM57344.1 unnamed protein product [Debaryomyces fabryi]